MANSKKPVAPAAPDYTKWPETDDEVLSASPKTLERWSLELPFPNDIKEVMLKNLISSLLRKHWLAGKGTVRTPKED